MKIPISKQQSGVILMVSLVMLLLLAVLGITSMRTAILEEKMVGNYRNNILAFQAAETALREAEKWLADAAVVSKPTELHVGDSANRVWGAKAAFLAGSWWKGKDKMWWDDNAIEVTTLSTPLLTLKPQYIIQYREFVGDTLEVGSTGRASFQITARGTGGRGQSIVLLQSIAAKRQ